MRNTTKIKQRDSAATQHIHLRATRLAEMNLVVLKNREGLLRNTKTHGWAMHMVGMDFRTAVRMVMLPRSKRAASHEAKY